ncbi:MAG: pyrroline-5-carboxylate reductase [Clostridia bacterium]|nr:pyrroline-5-carboxylate reductase [Clostridia bacterium]
MSTRFRSLAVLGVGNMASAIISGIISSDIEISNILLYDKNASQYDKLDNGKIPYSYALSATEAVMSADCVLLSVKPQNYDEILSEISRVEGCEKKLYISIGAGITSDSVSFALGGACVIRVLPNVPMIIGEGVSVICENKSASEYDFDFVCSVFKAAGSVLIIDEAEMNRVIGVTSSSPAYVFKFINAIYKGALSQKLTDRELLNSVCDVVIGSALMLKQSSDTPEELISKVASKGGTTEQALLKLDEYKFDEAISNAMLACTKRAEELGGGKK